MISMHKTKINIKIYLSKQAHNKDSFQIKKIVKLQKPKSIKVNTAKFSTQQDFQKLH